MKTQRFKVFGWIIHRNTLEAGEQFNVNILSDYAVEQAKNISLWTKGLVIGIKEDGTATRDKVPGHSVLDVKTVEQAQVQFTAQEDSEFWCINYTINRNSLPQLSKLHLLAGQGENFPAGAKLFIAAGEFSKDGAAHQGPACFVLKDESQIFAMQDVIGLVFP